MITAPPNTLIFRVPTFHWNSTSFSEVETEALKFLEVSKPYKSEFARLLIANCYETNGRFICNFEAFYSVARLLFSLNSKAKVENWDIVNRAVQDNPRIVFDALDLTCVEWFSHEQFFIFTLDGISAHLSADLALLGQTAARINQQLGPATTVGLLI